MDCGGSTENSVHSGESQSAHHYQRAFLPQLHHEAGSGEGTGRSRYHSSRLCLNYPRVLDAFIYQPNRSHGPVHPWS